MTIINTSQKVSKDYGAKYKPFSDKDRKTKHKQEGRMKKPSNKGKKYGSLMEFALFGKDDEVINLKTLIAKRKKTKRGEK